MPRTLDLAARIVDASNEQEERNVYFAGDNLFTPFERRRGLPIGNQTSQFFANVYLNSLDHFVARTLQPALYLCYVDDFVLFSDDKNGLDEMRAALVRHLAALRLELNEGKSRVYRCADGLRFLGWRFTPGSARLPREKVVGLRRRLVAVREDFHSGRLDFAAVERRVGAWRGHLGFGDTWELRRRLFRSFILVGAERGRNSARGLLEQQSTKPPRLEP